MDRFYDDFDQIDFNSPQCVRNSSTHLDQNDLIDLNKSFFHHQQNSMSIDSANSEETINSLETSLRKLNELETVLTANVGANNEHALVNTSIPRQTQTSFRYGHDLIMLDKDCQVNLSYSTIDNVNDICSNIHIDRHDIHTQTNLSVQDFTSFEVLRHKLDHLVSINKELTNNILLLEQKIEYDKQSFRTSTCIMEKEIEEYQSKNVELVNKVEQLELLLKYGNLIKVPALLDTNNHNVSTDVNLKSSCILKSEILKANKNCVNSNITKINIFADSHGRGLTNLLSAKTNYKVFGMIKSAARANMILDQNLVLEAVKRTDEVTVLLLGANDVYSNNSDAFLSHIEQFLSCCPNANIIIGTIPTRYDLPLWSIVNREINKVNVNILRLKESYSNIEIIDLEHLGKRFHSVHGLHLNKWGKEYVCNRLVELAYKLLNVCTNGNEGNTKISDAKNTNTGH
jgi:hypothetical protein